MATKRGLHATDKTVLSLVKSTDRIPLRSLQNELLTGQCSLSTFGTKPLTSSDTFLTKGEVADRKSELLPNRNAASFPAVPSGETENFNKNVLAFEMVKHECPAGKAVPDSPCSVQSEIHTRQSSSNASKMEENTRETGVCSDPGERLDYFIAGNSSPVSGETNDRVGDITLQSFVCGGVEIEIVDSSMLSEETVLPMTDTSLDYFSSDDKSLDILEESVPQSSCEHDDHIYCRLNDPLCSRTPLDSNASEVTASQCGTDVSCQCLPAFGLEDIINADPSQEATSGSCSTLHVFDERRTPVQSLSANEDEPQSEVTASNPEVSLVQISIAASSSQLFNASNWQASEDVAGLATSARSSTPVNDDESSKDLRAGLQKVSLDSNAVDDSALGLSENTPPPQAPECPEFGSPSVLLTPLPCSQAEACDELLKSALTTEEMRAAMVTESVRLMDLIKHSAVCQDGSTDCAVEGGKAFPRNHGEATPEKLHCHNDSRADCLWTENLESPMPRPQFNSTALSSVLSAAAAKPCTTEACRVPPVEPLPLAGERGPQDPTGRGHLQQQLRQMAEFLILASSDMATRATLVPVELHSASMSTSPVKSTERSVNTSGVFERKREFSVADASTSTDSLLWNLAPGSLDLVSRHELEQRLTSTLIVVESLFQQLASARGHSQSHVPSELRDKLIQTDHTELNQVGIYKDLYVKALEKIRTIELDQENLQTLLNSMQHMRIVMSGVSTTTEEALSSLNEVGHAVRDDQKSISEQMGRMKALYGLCMETLKRMGEKTQECLEERNRMRQLMEEALREKEAALSVTEQLRVLSASRIAELEQSLGSYQDLKLALTKTNLEQAELNKDYVESLQAANKLLTTSLCEQSSLYEELSKARFLLQKTNPLLLEMHEKAAAALSESNQRGQERDRAVEEKVQIQEELSQALSSLQDASQQIGDLNTQKMIMNSEMAVLRQRLSEAEEERGGLQMKNTQMSAMLSSTQASYSFLQHALADESHKLQQSVEESKQASERADCLAGALVESGRQLEELGQALSERDQRLRELEGQAQEYGRQLQRLPELQAQLSAVMEMNEFLQAENELSREQVAESEGLLRSHLQGLRERNLECEDLKQALSMLREEQESLQEELDSTREKARSMLLDMGEQLGLASTDVTLVLHRVRGLATSLQTTVATQKPDGSSKSAVPLRPPQTPRSAAGSFLDTVMIAIAVDEEQRTDEEQSTDAAVAESQEEALGSGNSAFTRVAPTTPKKEPEEESKVLELLSELTEAVSDLASTIVRVRDFKEAQQAELQQTVAGLQGELHEVSYRHRSEVADLKERVRRLQIQADKDKVTLQQKAEVEKSLKQLCDEMTESRELLQRQRSENNELRREVMELRQSLQQAQLEAQTLREELSRAGGQPVHSLQALDDKILLRKEVNKLKKNLAEVESCRSKLLDRAKRHQLVHEDNQRKLEKELRLLDEMIETVRKTLSSIPAVVSSCEELQKLVAYIG